MRVLVSSIADLAKAARNRRIYQFMTHLARKHEVTIISLKDWREANNIITSKHMPRPGGPLENVNIEYVTERKLSRVSQEIMSVTNASKALGRVRERGFDVHFCYNSLLLGYLVAKRMKATGIESVYDVADDLPAMTRTSPQVPAPLRPLAGLVARKVFKENLKIAKKIIVLTDSLRDSLNIPPSKSEIIPNGVDTKLFRPYPDSRLRNELGLDQNFVLGFVGTLRKWTDLELAFAAMSKLGDEKPVKCLIVGGGESLGNNMALAKKYGVSGRVIFTDTVPDVEVARYVSCMDICLLPFKQDSIFQDILPIKLFEYMACEKPIVSTRLKGVIEVCQDRVLYGSNAEELKQRIIELLENQPLRVRKGQEGKKFVEEHYTWPAICSRMEKVLLEAASTRNKNSIESP